MDHEDSQRLEQAAQDLEQERWKMIVFVVLILALILASGSVGYLGGKEAALKQQTTREAKP